MTTNRTRKQNLPQKLCPTCHRPFAWRKKWAKCWEEVKYCSRACAGHRARVTQ
jgi:hypothetical protein